MTLTLSAIKRRCTRNASLKILSLMLAVCIWSFTSLSRETRYELVLPVELRNTPPGYRVTPPLPGEVHFTLTGPSLLIDGARRSNSRVILSLRGIKPGKTLFSHLETYLKLPEGIKVTRISPAELEIELDREQVNSD
ncbi:YbbR-like domain-containing protein [Geobacter sp. AOG2]|uniref:CdaR family protein n=1 Tax=Geobacter sp. AOG2 TaxID=1566347 RepID=UPI001CC3C443|nr:hypothetical protein [Geobacter sp. AOG2]GFE61419.1 hypothetical protein AOG2_20060 [Geobacter sp. AOG2]